MRHRYKYSSNNPNSSSIKSCENRKKSSSCSSSSIQLFVRIWLLIVVALNNVNQSLTTPISVSTTSIRQRQSVAVVSPSPLASAYVERKQTTLSLMWRALSSKEIISTTISNLRVALAGGIAGATGTLLLYPLDTAKTLRQSNPDRYRDVRMALQEMVQGHAGKHQNIGMQQAYSGVFAAVLFSIPSSALYFGTYETTKNLLTKQIHYSNNETSTLQLRLTIHGIAAASGNIASSLIFVPKEFLKQQMQASKGQIPLLQLVKQTFETKGVAGFYRAYSSTLMRNIPSAILRFALYEELRRSCSSSSSIPLYFIQGALAGALSSGIMTPLDVVKTRIATNTIPSHLNVFQGLQYISKHHGIRNGLYAGARTRMIWSSAFSAIGFGTFEVAKTLLGVTPSNTTTITT